eukprot:3137868-Pleurochrysis_carterae.AAC.2
MLLDSECRQDTLAGAISSSPLTFKSFATKGAAWQQITAGYENTQQSAISSHNRTLALYDSVLTALVS